MNPDSCFDFPPELLVQPLVPIGVTGLDTLHNAIHRSVWESLNNSRRQDRAPVLFKLLSSSHEFPHPKEKRTHYDMHIPKGILKRSWMHKHLTCVPAVVVIFYDLDWDDPHWEERKLECISRVQSIRSALDGRGTKVCVVLIQQKASLPAGNELAIERASDLAQTADLNKSLFVLPYLNKVNGFIARLEKAFFDLGVSYYQHKIKCIMSHKEHLNKKTHQYLFVRHSFKLGFCSELKQDLSSAQVMYSDAYNNLLEVRLSDTNEFEVKTVAGFIAYKMCRLFFLLGKPREAISRFKALVEHYRHKKGHPQLQFQHFAWLSKQHSIFGNLFAEMIHLHNIMAVQTQHPGSYYQLAAKHAISRKLSAESLCPEDLKYPEEDPLKGWNSLEFFGQRPWRPCQLSAEPLDPERERCGIQALQYVERHNVNHSAIIISLLGNAVSQFKTFKCPRMKKQLVIKMADEYFISKDYGKALTLLTHMLWDYRVEKWFVIFDKVLVTAIACAYLTASLSDYVGLSIEAMARLSDPLRILNNFVTVTKGGVPEPEPQVTDEKEIMEAEEAWKNCKPSGEPVTIDMENVFSSLICRAHIEEAAYNLVTVTVYITSGLPSTIVFSRLSVCVSVASSSFEVVILSDGEFQLGINEVSKYSQSFAPKPADVAKTVKILSVLMAIGKPEGRQVILKFSGLDPDHAHPYPELLYFSVGKHGSLKSAFGLESCELSRTISRRQAEASLTVSTASPALLTEWFPVSICLTNNESTMITDICITITLGDSTIESSTSICEVISEKLLSLPLNFKFAKVDMNEHVNAKFFIKSDTLQNREFNIEAVYNVNKDQCLIEKNVSFDVVSVFELTTKFMNKKFEPLDKHIYSRETFLCQTRIMSISPWPILIHSTKYTVDRNVSFETDYTCSLSGSVLNKGEVGLCVASLITNKPSDKPISLATLCIQWSRKGGDDGGLSESKVSCFSTVEDTPITICIEPADLGSSELRSPCHVRQSFPLTFILTNHTSLLLTFQLFIEASYAFMFSGHKQLVINILPESRRKLEYCLTPLIAGDVPIPRLKLAPLTPAIASSHINQIIDRMVPTSLFVLPPIRKLAEQEVTSFVEL